jgi:hypothetical protein
MKFDTRPNAYDDISSTDAARTEAIYQATIGRQHPDTEVLLETASQGALIPPALEAELQALVSGRRSRGGTAAQAMRELLGISTPSNSMVGDRSHGSAMKTSPAASYGSLVESLKMLLADAEEASVMTRFGVDDEDDLLDVDAEMGSDTNDGDLQSEITYLSAKLEELQKQLAAKKGVGVSKSRYGLN